MAQEKPTMYESVMNKLGLAHPTHEQTGMGQSGIDTTSTGLSSGTTGLPSQAGTPGMSQTSTMDSTGTGTGLSSGTGTGMGSDYSTPRTDYSSPVQTGSLESDTTKPSDFGSNDIYAQGNSRLGEPAAPTSGTGMSSATDSYSAPSSYDEEPLELQNPEGGYSDSTVSPHKESTKEKIKHMAEKVKGKLGGHH